MQLNLVWNNPVLYSERPGYKSKPTILYEEKKSIELESNDRAIEIVISLKIKYRHLC